VLSDSFHSATLICLLSLNFFLFPARIWTYEAAISCVAIHRVATQSSNPMCVACLKLSSSLTVQSGGGGTSKIFGVKKHGLRRGRVRASGRSTSGNFYNIFGQNPAWWFVLGKMCFWKGLLRGQRYSLTPSLTLGNQLTPWSRPFAATSIQSTCETRKVHLPISVVVGTAHLIDTSSLWSQLCLPQPLW